MPSPQWCQVQETPIGQAIAAAQHDAWQCAPARRRARFAERYRQLVGPKRADLTLAAALSLFDAQAEAPTGWEAPPASAYWQACPRCQRLRATPHTRPLHGRLELAVLRDAAWLEGEFLRGRTPTQVARRLRCSTSLVSYWAEQHGLETPAQEAKAARADLEAAVRRLHAEDRGPGGIAAALDVPVRDVRRALRRLGLATRKAGMVYFRKGWWEERLVAQGWTVRQCATEAGIKPHNATYYVTKFGLGTVTAARAARPGRARWRAKYPALADREQLTALLAEHGTYEAVARAVGCPSPSLVSRYARALLGAEVRHRQGGPHAARAWWTVRLDAGATTWALAEESGLAEKTVREKLRLLDVDAGTALLAQAYRNNAAAERARRAPSAPDSTRREATRSTGTRAGATEPRARTGRVAAPRETAPRTAAA